MCWPSASSPISIQNVAVDLVRRIARVDALSAHDRRYARHSSAELLPSKPVGLDNYVLANRDFTEISFVYFRLNPPGRSICQTEQGARSDCAKGFAGSRVDSQNSSGNRSLNCALLDPFLCRSHAAFRGEHFGVCPRLFFLQRRRGEQFLGPNGGLEVSFRHPEITIGLLVSSPGDLSTLIQGALHTQP